MFSKKVMRFPSKVAVPVSLFRKSANERESVPTVGSEACVQITTFVAYDAINEGCVCTCEDFMEGVGCVGHC